MRTTRIHRASLALLVAGPVSISWAQDTPPGPAAAAPADVATIPVAQIPDAAPAPTPEADGATRLAPVYVTAQKRKQSLSEVPITISAFNGEQLAQLGVNDTRDLGLVVPGLAVNDSGQGTPIYTLRGVGYNDTTYTATGTVGLYLDEVDLPYSVMSKGLAVDIERVEILKGPQGTLYGRNTTGGLIDQIANKPTENLQTGLKVGYGRFKTVDGEGYVSGPLADTVRGRIAVRALNEDQGWQYSNTRPDDHLGRMQKGSARAALEWQPAESFQLRLVGDGWVDRSQPQAPQAVGINPQNGILGSAALSPDVKSYPLIPQDGASNQVADWSPDRAWRRNDRFESETLRADWRPGDTTQWITQLSHLRVEANPSDDIQSGFNFYNLESSTTAFINTTSVESRFSGQFGDALHWMFGGNVSHDKASEDHYVLIDTESAFFPIEPAALTGVLQGLAADGLDFGQTAQSIPGVPAQYSGIVESVQNGGSPLTNRFHSQGRVDNREYAAFLNLDWQFVRTLTLNLGARETINNQDFHGCSREAPESVGLGASNLSTFLSFLDAAQYTLQTGQPGNPSVAMKGDCFSVGADGNHNEFHGTLDERNVSGRVALSWQPAPEYLAYASVSRGYKAGGFPVLNACCQYQFAPTRQERLDAAETGAKLTLLDRRVQINLAAFYYDYTDKQLLTKVRDPVFGPLPVLRNAPRSHVYGGEIELQSRPLNGLYLSVAAARIVTQIDEFVSTNDQGNTQDFAGRPFNFSPPYEINGVADYTATLGSWEAGLGVNVQRSGDTNGTLAQTPAYDMPAYTLLGAQLHLATPTRRWTARVYGYNLTNAFYSEASFNIGDSIARFAGFPRTYGIALAYNLQ
ncbi:MAG TPA: TonB-dependent receptor [Nevskiaceae bacterium]|nr:TonB-dependent receptor [Nevskiaceae bacterium]